MAKTKIEWTDMTWNPVTGCSPISEGCQHCYARRMAYRLRGRYGYNRAKPFRVTLHPERLGDPLKCKKSMRVFVCSMGDLFHDDVPDEFIARVWWVMGQCAGYLDPSRYRGHTFLVLTKRPERMREWLRGWFDQETRKRWIESLGEVYDWMSGPKYWPDVIDNVWLGVSVENQEAADERIPLLLQIPAVVHFASAEPLLGPLDLTRYLRRSVSSIDHAQRVGYWNVGRGLSDRLDWVITGGETGPGARPMHPDWVRNLRDQCLATKTPFFLKSWGEFVVPEDGVRQCRVCGCTENNACDGSCWWVEHDLCSNCVGKPTPKSRAVKYQRVGKKAAGRLLDGRTWDESPQMRSTP